MVEQRLFSKQYSIAWYVRVGHHLLVLEPGRFIISGLASYETNTFNPRKHGPDGQVSEAGNLIND